MNDVFLTDLYNIIEAANIREHEPMKNHTTFKVGGAARVMVDVDKEESLINVLTLIKKHDVPFFLLGNGSNLLVADSGYDGVVIRLTGEFKNISVCRGTIEAGASARLFAVCTAARDNALSGLEFAYGIPGFVGGAMVMNAGAYDGEMSMVVNRVKVLDVDSMCVLDMSNGDMKFGYRDSIVKHKPYIVLSAVFGLKNGSKEDISSKMNDFMMRRQSKQPLEFPSAGSTFKRPTGYYAGKLIEDSGLKGARVGGACVSPKHCGFVINDDNATATDIYRLMSLVTDTVREKFGVELEAEVIKVGSFDEC